MSEYHSQDPDGLSASDRTFLEELAGLKPVVAAGLDARVVFAAGRAEGFSLSGQRRRIGIWRNAAALLAVGLLGGTAGWQLADRRAVPVAVTVPGPVIAAAGPSRVAGETVHRKRTQGSAKSLDRWIDEWLTERGHGPRRWDTLAGHSISDRIPGGAPEENEHSLIRLRIRMMGDDSGFLRP